MDAPANPLPPESTPAASLLPALLLRPAALVWLWVLPIGLVLLLNLQGYQLIAGNMDAAQLSSARQLGWAGLANLLLGLALFAVAHGARLPSAPRFARLLAWSVPGWAVASQVAYLALAVGSVDHVIPRSVAAWIYPPPHFLFNQFAFGMLPIALGVLRLASVPSALPIRRTLAAAAALAVGAPILLYVFGLVLRTFPSHRHISGPVFATIIVVCGLAMFLGIVHGLLVGLRWLRAWPGYGERLAIVLVAFVLPLGGLVLNRSIDFPVDFQAWEVYALVAANTGILLFASTQHAQRPLLSFGLLAASFPFTLYFFIVFLPYTPLSILAVLACGLGFLVLCPTFLFLLHLHLLHQAGRHPRLDGRRTRLAAVGLLSALLLPAFFVVRGLADRAALRAALDYAFAPAIPAGDLTYPGSLANLRRALANHRSYKNGIYYPLLSDFYTWLVFDRLVLPDDKLAHLESIFLGHTASAQNSDPVRSPRRGFFGPNSVRERTRMPHAVQPPRGVAVSDLTVRTAAAGEQATTVTLALTLQHADPRHAPAEYLAALPLPAGVYASGFRLQVNGTLVPGRLFEKKTALWVYAMIRDAERRDPGLLYYRQPGELELRVFPISPDSPVLVEVDFLFPGALSPDRLPSDLRDPGRVLHDLAAQLRPTLMAAPAGTVVTGGLDRLALPAVDREPYLHVIVDRSDRHGFRGDLAAALPTLARRFPTARQARVTLAHHDVADLVVPLTPLAALPRTSARDLDHQLACSGGLALDLALARALRQHRETDLDRPAPAGSLPPRPVFVILSQHAAARDLDLSCTTAWTDLLPSLELHELGTDGSFRSHLAPAVNPTPLLRLGTSRRPLSPGGAARFPSTAPAVPLEYWSPGDNAWKTIHPVSTAAVTDVWSRAATLHLLHQDHTRSPGDAAFDLPALVAASRASGVLLPGTSYIVVENPAQWRMLEKSERQKLDQNSALAFRETPAPSALWLGIPVVLWLALRTRRQARFSRTAEPAAHHAR